jgi:hypothetical protein
VGEFGVASNLKQLVFVWEIQRVSLLLSFLQRSGKKSTQLPSILSILKEANKIKNEVWFFDLLHTSSKIMVYFNHQNKGSWFALSPLCT